MTDPETPTLPVPEFDPSRVNLFNGIVLRTKPVNANVQQRVALTVPLPVPPLAPGPGGTEEPNPLDPDYLDELYRASSERLDVVARMLYALGTEVHSVPEGMFEPFADGWWEPLEAAGVPLDRESWHLPFRRYRDWLMLYAFTIPADEGATWGAVIARSGILESEVQKAIDAFRTGAERMAAKRLPPAAPDPDGDPVPPVDPGTRS